MDLLPHYYCYYFLSLPEDIFFIVFRERKGERHRCEREASIGCLLVRTWTGNKPPAYICALPGNWLVTAWHPNQTAGPIVNLLTHIFDYVRRINFQKWELLTSIPGFLMWECIPSAVCSHCVIIVPNSQHCERYSLQALYQVLCTDPFLSPKKALLPCPIHRWENWGLINLITQSHTTSQ